MKESHQLYYKSDKA